MVLETENDKAFTTPLQPDIAFAVMHIEQMSVSPLFCQEGNMEKIINFFEKNVKLILGTIFVVCILNCIICICKDIKLLEALLVFGISIGLFFVAWGMVFVVLGLQKINPSCPESVFKFFCYFIIIIGAIGVLFGIVHDIILCLIKDKNDMFPFAYSTGSLGFIYGSIFLYRKTFGNRSREE